MRALPGAIAHVPWEIALRDSVRAALRGEKFYKSLVDGGSRLHLAVLVEPYLSLLLSGGKTMESRFSMTRRPPFGRVNASDILILKRSAGPIVGVCHVTDVQFYHLDPSSVGRLRSSFDKPLAIVDDGFWERQANMRYATLMRVSHPRPLVGIRCGKRDQRGWVTLES